MLNSANKHNTKEAECHFNTAAVPVRSFSSSYSVCLWSCGRSVPHQAKCVRLQIFSYSPGTSILLHMRLQLNSIYSCIYYTNIRTNMCSEHMSWYKMQAFIILSCLIAVSVNFSTFLVIGKTSPVTYQVLGHLKTCLVLAFGYTLLHDPFTERNIIGITIAVFGMGLYSYFCLQENKKKQSVDLSLGSQVRRSIFFFKKKIQEAKNCCRVLNMRFLFSDEG